MGFIFARLIAAVIGVLGLLLGGGGAYLLVLGGSPYYLPIGIAILVTAVLIWQGRRSGDMLYAAVCMVTLVWAVSEVGLDGWQLLPRLDLIFGLGLALLIVRAIQIKGRALRTGVGTLVAVLLLIFLGSLWSARGPARTDNMAVPLAGTASTDWAVSGSSNANQRFSELSQITPANVAGLKVAWTIHLSAGAPPGEGLVLEGTPIKVGDTLYMCDMTSRIHALNPETGAARWVFTPEIRSKSRTATCRGITYAKIAEMAPGEHCSERLIMATKTAQMFAVDAHDGKACLGFGEKGVVDTSVGITPAPEGYYQHRSPPMLVRGRLVLGSTVLDGQYRGEPSGVIRAFDARTGGLAWAWDMGRPDDKGMPPPGQYFTPGTPNSWPGFAADEKNGLVFVPTGNGTPDYVMSHRTPEMNKYASSLVALDIETGNVRWSFQTTHLDQWDYDVASPPTLIDAPVNGGGTIPAVVQATKRGQIFILDRLTGKPIVPVIERKVPTDGVPGETYALTQPYSMLPSMGGERLTERAMWGITPLDHLWCRIKFKEARYDGDFTPIMTDRYTITFPGYIGGSNWGGVAYDPVRQLLAINANYFPMYNRLIPRVEADKKGLRPYQPGINQIGSGNFNWPQMGTLWAAANDRMMGPFGAPCNAPPWGTLAVVDLKTRQVAWKEPLGKARDSGPFGLASHLPYMLGTPQIGGALVTKSGLIFLGTTQEKTFRAIDTGSGKVLWEDRLPAGAHAAPMTYYSEKSGRQFVVVAASGHFLFDNGKSDLLIAYTLQVKK